ncbi:MAG: DeoR/GlpR family DNA-binding transcription regulator [Phycisphaerales bacterium]
MAQKSVSHERQNAICQMIKANKSFSVSELAKRFDVSEMTIHRDLNKLQNQGHITRTHGGVIAAERMEFEFDFASRRTTNQKAKKAIAQKAFEFIRPGSKILLDTGTTTLELAYLLKNFSELTVITPSLAVASVLQFSAGVQTVLLGGILRKGRPDLTGVVTEKVLDMFMVDIAFQGADGIGMDGELFNEDMRIAKVDQKIRQRARKSYILSDSSKIGQTSLASNGNLSQVEAFITDNNITNEQICELKKTGTEIIICEI